MGANRWTNWKVKGERFTAEKLPPNNLATLGNLVNLTKGCRAKKPDGTFGDPELTDIVVKP